MSDVGGEFIPEQSFFEDNQNMSFAELTAAISGEWTLIWDANLQPTRTDATIGFGTVMEGEFLEVPTITTPVDGSVSVPPNTSIDWTYDQPACDAQRDIVEVCLRDPSQAVVCSGELPCETTSWTPPSPLEEGAWTGAVFNAISIRTVAGGIGGPIEGDPWNLENEDWLDLQSVDLSQFTVSLVAVEAATFGAVKAVFGAEEVEETP